MAKENVKALCLRFDLDDEEELKAYDHLQNRDKAEFGSYTKLVSRAVNEFFERRARLEADPTRNYAIEQISGNNGAQEIADAYNTYVGLGLPPGPICNPGNDAIYAALFPDDTNYYYFRHDKFGKIYMAKTQAEHDRNGIEVLRVNSR